MLDVKHPLEQIPEGGLRRWQIPSLVVALVCLAALPIILPGRENHTLLDLVEAGSADAAASVLGHWSNLDRVRVAHAVGLDYLMNPAYMTVFAISCVWAGRIFNSDRLRTVAASLAWLCWSVVLTNAAENVGLLVALVGGTLGSWPAIVAAAHYWAGFVVVLAVGFSAAGLVRRAKPIDGRSALSAREPPANLPRA